MKTTDQEAGLRRKIQDVDDQIAEIDRDLGAADLDPDTVGRATELLRRYRAELHAELVVERGRDGHGHLTLVLCDRDSTWIDPTTPTAPTSNAAWTS